MVIKICSVCEKRYEQFDFNSYEYKCPRCRNTKKKKKKFLFYWTFLFILGLMFFVSATKVPTNVLEPIQINTWEVVAVKENTQYNFVWDLRDNFGLVNNTAVTCLFFLQKAGTTTPLVSGNASTPPGDKWSWYQIVKGANFSETGIYNYQIDCFMVENTSVSGTALSSFQVTQTGELLNTSTSISRSMTNLLILIFSFVVFIGLLVAGIMLPSRNESNELTGYIIAVSNMKYVKLFCLAFSYLVAMFISYFMWSVLYRYSDLDYATEIFRFISWTMIIAVFPLFILWMYFIITNWIRDSKIADMLSRGLTVK